MSETKTFESWAVVELFGHQRIAGLVTEATIGGCSFVRVDVPEQPARERHGYMDAQPPIPAYTRYFGQGAIYALNPCSETIARRTAEEIRTRPPIAYDVPDIVARPQLIAPDDPDVCIEHGRAWCSECDQ